MRDWYMENGDRTWVNPDADIAYDTDNDAWVPLGSSEGSTPYWWRFYDKGEGSYSSEEKKEESEEQKKRAQRRKAAQERLETIEARIPELESKANATSFYGMGLVVGVPLLILLVVAAYSSSGGDLSNVASVFYFWLFVIGAVVLASIIGVAHASSCDSNAKALKVEAQELKKELGIRR